MITKSELTSPSDKVTNTIDAALGFMMFVTKEQAEKYKTRLKNIRIDIAYELSQKNIEYEITAKKCLKVVQEEYLAKITDYANSEKRANKIPELRKNITQMSDDFIDSTKRIINISDESFTVNNICSKIRDYSVKTELSDFIGFAANNILQLQEVCVDYNDPDSKKRDELRSKFDTFCIKSQNILFHKYLDMLSLLHKYEYITQTIDALTILSMVISKEKLWTKDLRLNFLRNKPFENVLSIIRRSGDID